MWQQLQAENNQKFVWLVSGPLKNYTKIKKKKNQRGVNKKIPSKCVNKGLKSNTKRGFQKGILQNLYS